MLEAKYTKETSLEYRKEFGQFFTPPLVARLMVQWVMKDNPHRILDPAFGLGVFLDEIERLESAQGLHFTGYEIDKRILDYFNHKEYRLDPKIVNGDYLEADLGAFDGIICNPPYMRFQYFLNRHNVLPRIEAKIGKKLVGYSNISSVFLVKALRELSPGGRLAFIMPFEFFNTGYGREIKKSLLEAGLLKQIVVFANEREIFPNATTTVCVLLCRNDRKSKSIKISKIESEDQIRDLSCISEYYQHEIEPEDLPWNQKWTPIISSVASEQVIPEGFCRISQYGEFRRGIATGANVFFALRKTQIAELGIDKSNIRACITKSNQIRKPVFTCEDFDELYNGDKPVHCLDVRDHDSLTVLDYLARGESQGFHHRYLTKNRNPWYKIEYRQVAPILFGVFNRGRLKVIRNYSDAINFTCFHAFYPNLFGNEIVNKLFVFLLSDFGQSIVLMNKRSYGNNLDKFEPGDLNDCYCPSQEQFGMIVEWEASQVIETAKIDTEAAIRLSNDLLERIVNAESLVQTEENTNLSS